MATDAGGGGGWKAPKIVIKPKGSASVTKKPLSYGASVQKISGNILSSIINRNVTSLLSLTPAKQDPYTLASRNALNARYSAPTGTQNAGIRSSRDAARNQILAGRYSAPSGTQVAANAAAERNRILTGRYSAPSTPGQVAALPSASGGGGGGGYEFDFDWERNYVDPGTGERVTGPWGGGYAPADWAPSHSNASGSSNPLGGGGGGGGGGGSWGGGGGGGSGNKGWTYGLVLWRI